MKAFQYGRLFFAPPLRLECKKNDTQEIVACYENIEASKIVVYKSTVSRKQAAMISGMVKRIPTFEY